MNQATIETIKKFCQDRNWTQFHNEKDLAISIVLEASELLENFQWQTSKEALASHEASIREELADVLIYATLLCSKLGLDMDQIVMDKLKINAEKYPIDLAYGKKEKYTQLSHQPSTIGNVAVQPYSNPIALDHFQHTLMQPVPYDDIKHFLSASDQKMIQDCYPDGNLYIWGTQPNATTFQWDKLCSSDVVLFYRKKRFHYRAQVLHKLHDPQLAQYLWGTAEDGTTWENIYFVTELVPLDIEVQEYNRILNYDENALVRSFYVHPDRESELLIQQLSL